MTVKKKKNRRGIKVLKILCLLPAVLLMLLTAAGITGRSIHRHRHPIDPEKGVDESIFVPVCGQEQYLLLRGRNTENPVILYLHGGPAGPDAAISNVFSDYLIDDYTVVCWDQRGCGRTYYHNQDKDPENTTATFEQALRDTDAVVEYLRGRFHAGQVIIMGHSYGSLLGSRYVKANPDKVRAFVGIGQFVNVERSDELSYQDALNAAAARNEDPAALHAAYQKYLNAADLKAFLELRKATAPYHPASVQAHTMRSALFSPYTGISDARWTLKQMLDPDGFFARNRQLFDLVSTCDIYDDDLNYPVPAFFISGDRDFVCNYTLSEQYCKDIHAPLKEFAAVSGCGHVPQFAVPEAFTDILKGMLDKCPE